MCQFRRVAKDLKDDWANVMRLLDTANDEDFLSITGPGFFPDLDMLEVGNPGNWRSNYPGATGMLTHDEQAAHFSLWAAMKSPLVIGADPRSLSEEALAILSNREVIAVNQDSLAIPARMLPPPPARVSSGGASAECVGYLVSGAGTTSITQVWRDPKSWVD